MASCLRLDEYANLASADRDAIANWNPQIRHKPPKVLADLFESHVGAIYLFHGWNKAWTWIQLLFEPLAKMATGDFWYFDLRLMPAGYYNSSSESGDMGKLLDFYLFKKDYLIARGQDALDSLPASTLFSFTDSRTLESPNCERLEVAVHLINLWICRICLKLWPEYHRATAKAAHLLSVRVLLRLWR
jgi:hypothetical protein